MKLPRCLVALLGVLSLGWTSIEASETVEQAKQQPLSSAVTVRDLVLTSITDHTETTANSVIYGQDETGGIAIIASTENIERLLAGPDGIALTADDVRPGHRLQSLTGTLAFFEGLYEIGEIPVPQQYVYGANETLPEPLLVTADDFADGSVSAEFFEGQRVALSDVRVDVAGELSGFRNYQATTPNGPVTVRIPTTSSELVGVELPGVALNLTGIFGQFDTTEPRDSGYNLVISTLDDLSLTAETLVAISLGDFNLDGTVNAADYTVWRDNENVSGPLMLPDGNRDRTVDRSDYDLWVGAFGRSETLPALSAGIPEPSSSALWGVAIASASLLRSRAADR